jgi:hypothetical protein
MSTERHSKPVGLGDIMQVPGIDKNVMHMLNAQVEFVNGCEELWDGVYQLDLIFDSFDFSEQFIRENSKGKRIKLPMKIHKVETLSANVGQFIMFGTVNEKEYVLKCSSKRIVNAPTALFVSNRIVSSMENEVLYYKYVSSKPKLQKQFLKMFAHGHLLQLAGSYMNDYVIRQWDCMILEKGSDLDLLKWVMNMKSAFNKRPTNEMSTIKTKMQELTTVCFSLLKNMHDSDIVHGDLRIDQYLWQTNNQLGSNDLKMIDLDRALIVDECGPLTKNLRKLMDINFLLIMNPFNVFLFGIPNFQHYNMQYIRNKMPTVAGVDLKRYFIPDILMWNTNFLIVDDNSTAFVCKKYYKDEDFQFLRNLDIDSFLQYLFNEENLFHIILFIVERAIESMLPNRAKSDYYSFQDIPHPAFEDTELKYQEKVVESRLLVPTKVVNDIVARREQAQQQAAALPPPPPPAPSLMPVPYPPAPGMPPFVPQPPPPAAAVPPPVPVPQNASSVVYHLNYQGHGIFNERGQPIQIQIKSGTANISGTEGYDLNHLIPAYVIANMQVRPFLVNHAMAIQHLHWRVEGQNVEFWAVNLLGQASFILSQNVFR